MITSSHLIITAALGKRWPHLWPWRGAALWGSLAPDIPLYLLTLGGVVYYHLVLGWELRQTLQHLFHTLFFQHPGWIAAHNALHSPTLLGILGLITWQLRYRFAKTATWLLTFLASCGLHTLIDILVHTDDGPLLFFPFEWTIRFRSPISYWDPRYYGDEFAWFEWGLVVVLLTYLARGWLSRKGADRVG